MVDRRRKVLFLFPFPSLGGGGGAQQVFATLLRHLDRDRFELHLALLQAERGPNDGIPEGVSVYNLNCSRTRYVVPTLIGLIRDLRPSVALSTVGHMNLALLLCRPLLPRSTRLLVRESTTLQAYLQQATNHPQAWAALYRLLYKHADTVICLSDAMQQEMEEQFRVPRTRLVRIYNPVDVERIRSLARLHKSPYTGSGPHLMAAGRFVREKGIDLLLDAMPHVVTAFPQATLTLLGEGPLASELKQQAERLKIGDAVKFAGVQANPWHYFRDASLVIVPSRVDGFSSVPLEALALGTRVVATDCPGGIREVAQTNDGIVLVPSDDANALGEGIVSALAQSNKGGHSPQLDHFSLQQAVEKYSALFEA